MSDNRVEFNTQTARWEDSRGRGLKEIQGLVFNPYDQYAYKPINELVALRAPYTFEVAGWTGPWWAAPLLGTFNIFGTYVTGSLNPFGFATAETAQEMLATVKRYFPPNAFNITLVDQGVTGPFTRTPERSIRFYRIGSGQTEDLSAGQIAVSIIKNGLAAAMQYVKADVESSLYID